MKKLLMLLLLFSCKKEEIIKQEIPIPTHDVVLTFQSGCGGYEVYFNDANRVSQHTTSTTDVFWSYSFKASKGDCLYFFGREYNCPTPGYYRGIWRIQVDGIQTKYINDTGSEYLRDTIK